MDTILFDMDGTLLDTLDDLHASVNHALRQNGFPEIRRDEVRALAGYGAVQLVDDLLHGEYCVDSPQFKKVFSAFSEHYAEHHNDTTKPYGGIVDLLEALQRRGIQMGVVSNKTQVDAAALSDLWFANYIEMTVGRVDGVPPKPAPDMIDSALRKMGGSPERTIYLGDSEPDVQVARAAGCVSVCCTWGFRSREILDAQHPDFIIDQPEQLLDILDELEQKI